MPWTPLTFGKHNGKTIPQVLFKDPDWFFWAWEEKVFDQYAQLKPEAVDANRKARSIRIPSDGTPMRADYLMHPVSKNFTGLDIVPQDRRSHNALTISEDVIDLSVPRRVQNYDKKGCKILIKEIRPLLFPGVKVLTRTRLETFFDDPANFAP